MSRRHVPLLLSLLVLFAAALFVVGTPSHAEEGEDNHIIYLSVTGEGPNAKAWYDGAPPAGVAVQTALDHFSSLGYHVVEVRPYQRPIVTVVVPDQGVMQEPSIRDEFFIILLEK